MEKETVTVEGPTFRINPSDNTIVEVCFFGDYLEYAKCSNAKKASIVRNALEYAHQSGVI